MKPKHYGQEPPSNWLDKLRVAVIPHESNRMVWMEVLLITLLALGLAAYTHPQDPFLLHSQFPWLWFAPVLVALRYGVSAGVISSSLLLCAWLSLQKYNPIYTSFPEQHFLGGLILMMICGEFSSAWRIRLHHTEENNQYLDQRLARLTKRHILLNLSHERMEQELLSKPVNLRDAIISLREFTFAKTSNDFPPAAEPLLSLLTQYCQLESAALFAIEPNNRYRRIAKVGAAFELNPQDSLIVYAMKHRQMAHLLTKDLDDMPSNNLVAAPITSSGGALLGLLVINRMPFFALTSETLQMLAAILAYYADCVSISDPAKQFAEEFPDAPYEFAEEFIRMRRMQQETKVTSHIVVFNCGYGEIGEATANRIIKVKRGLDVAWQQRIGDDTYLLMLMPLAGRAAVDGYFMRLESMLQEQLGRNFDALNLTPRTISLSSANPQAALKEALSAC